MHSIRAFSTLAMLFMGPLAHASDGICKFRGMDCTTVVPPAIATPANMGQYCSMRWPDGGWAFTSYTNLTSDPCGSVPSSVIQRAGLYSTNDINNVLENCDGKVGRYRGVGNQPLTEAYNDADGNNRANCVFTVSPDAFPIFNSPFDWTDSSYSHGVGFDFARPPYASVPLIGGAHTLLLDSQGQPRDGTHRTTITSASNGLALPFTNRQLHVASTAGYAAGTNNIVVEKADHAQANVTCSGLGSDGATFTGCTTGINDSGTLATGGNVVLGFGFNDDHAAHDYVMNDGTQLVAVADGVVDMVRARPMDHSDADGCTFDSNGTSTGNQVEVYIRHRVAGGGGSSRYDEVYEAIYDHLESFSVHIGDVVRRGDPIGKSGHSGCTGGTPHVHFAVLRLTNTTAARNNTLTITNYATMPVTSYPPSPATAPSDDGGRIAIEPDGFAGSATSVDPWGWRPLLSGSTDGAFSPKLWRSLQQQPPVNPFASAFYAAPW